LARAFGANALRVLPAGTQTLPLSLTMVIASPFAGRLAARHGSRTTVTADLAGLGPLALGAVHADTGYGNGWWRLFLVGTGFALPMSPATGAAVQAVAPGKAASPPASAAPPARSERCSARRCSAPW
jgi:MFS family permease